MRKGISFGLTAALIFVTVVLLTGLLGADESDLPAGITLAEQIALFIGSGIAGGALGGLLISLTHSRAGGVLFGMIVMAPYFIGQNWLAEDAWASPLATGIAIVLVGGCLGYWIAGLGQDKLE